jgi:hypothetical protein
LSFGSFLENRLCAPVAVYRAKLHPHDESQQWLFIQHGSYQWISSADQPHVEEGHALLYRGIQTEKTFRYPSVERDLQQLANQRTWSRYLALPTVAHAVGFDAFVQYHPRPDQTLWNHVPE